MVPRSHGPPRHGRTRRVVIRPRTPAMAQDRIPSKSRPDGEPAPAACGARECAAPLLDRSAHAQLAARALGERRAVVVPALEALNLAQAYGLAQLACARVSHPGPIRRP